MYASEVRMSSTRSICRPDAAGGRSLAATGFDALVIHAGCPPTQFLDDQDVPLQSESALQSLGADSRQSAMRADLSCRACGPGCSFINLTTTGTSRASLPSEPWTRVRRSDADARSRQRAAPHWASLGRVAFIGRQRLLSAGASRQTPSSTTRICSRGCTTTGPSRPPTSSNACAVRARWAPGVTVAALAAFRRGASEYEAHMQYLAACAQREEEMPYNNIVAYNEHAAVLHYQHLDRRPPRTSCALS